MDKSLEIKPIVVCQNDPATTDESNIAKNEILLDEVIKKEKKFFPYSEIYIKEEPYSNEDETKYPVIEAIYNSDIKSETEDLNLETEYLKDVMVQDPLHISTEIKDEDVLSESAEEGKIFLAINFGKLYESQAFGETSILEKLQVKNKQKVQKSRRKYICKICNKEFRQKCHLDAHFRIHTGKKDFTCRFCKKSFNQKSNLTRHLIFHTGEKRYVCDICQKICTDKTNLNVHKMIHSDLKPYSCDECKKSFRRNGDLVKHKRTHSGERPYACDLCYKTFSLKPHLNEHRRLHTGEKPFSCDVCGKSFAQKPSLTHHKRTRNH